MADGVWSVRPGYNEVRWPVPFSLLYLPSQFPESSENFVVPICMRLCGPHIHTGWKQINSAFAGKWTHLSRQMHYHSATTASESGLFFIHNLLHHLILSHISFHWTIHLIFHLRNTLCLSHQTMVGCLRRSQKFHLWSTVPRQRHLHYMFVRSLWLFYFVYQ